MSALAFEDVHKHSAEGHYVVPNEHMGVWLQMTKGLKFKRAASICSSGEVGFFTLLPQVSEELLMLDHSYKSLTVAAIKYLLMADMGINKTRKLFANGDVEALKAEITRVSTDLPPALLRHHDEVVDKTYESFTSQARKLAEEWKFAPAARLRSAGNKLDKVTFMHGDLTDAVARGPFDMFYISNAMEHNGRDHKHPVPAKIAEAVKPGGYVLACGRYSGDRMGTSKHPEGWEIVQFINLASENYHQKHTGFNHASKIRWGHTLYRLPEAV